MTGEVFAKGMMALSKNYSKNVFNPDDPDMAKMWFGLLKHIDDTVFMNAVHKILVNEVFAPNLAIISKYCAEIAAPIEVDDSEGWGLVVKAINNYGYMRADEAMNSLPKTVRDAVTRMGGFEMICESEEPDVLRGQFYKAMASINQGERTNRREREGLENAISLMNEIEPMKLETESWKRSSEDVVKEGMAKISEAFALAGIKREKK